MMDQRDPWLRQARGEAGKGRQGQTVDDRQSRRRHRFDGATGGGAGRPIRARKGTRELVHFDLPVRAPKTFDDPLVVDVPAGALVERAGHDEMQGGLHALEMSAS
jgi:hypothetical protein